MRRFGIPFTFPLLLRPLVRPAVTRLSSPDTVFFTFDDGPTPGVTETAVKILKNFGATATFFLIGDKVNKHSALARNLAAAGHGLGNHTFNHADAWKMSADSYMQQISLAALVMRKHGLPLSGWFRPPYGHITPKLLRRIKQRGCRTALWTHLTRDYDSSVDPLRAAHIIKRRLRPGDIIVFHDSRKAQPGLEIILPRLLEAVYARGWKVKALPSFSINPNQADL